MRGVFSIRTPNKLLTLDLKPYSMIEVKHEAPIVTITFKRRSFFKRKKVFEFTEPNNNQVDKIFKGILDMVTAQNEEPFFIIERDNYDYP